MKPAHVGVSGRQGDWEPGRHILGKSRVIAGGERELPFQTNPPGRQAERTFGGDVDRFGFERLETFLNSLVRPDRESYFRIGRQRDGRKLVGTDYFNLCAHAAKFGDPPG